MAPSGKQAVAQLKGVWERQTPRRRVLAAVVLVGTAIALFFLARSGSGPDYAPLYTGLTPQDAGEIAAELQAQSIPYRLGAGGTSIEVPAADVPRVRMAIASAGLPRAGGVGFEIFDEQKFGTSSFVEQVNYRRALQGELSRSIAALDSVESARVHLAMGRRSVFRDADEPPSASVGLKLVRGRDLGRAQVQGIVHLVSSSVDGLSPDRVVVIDDRGNVLSSGDGQPSGADVASELEASLTKRVREMVERVVGPGHASVVVTAEMDKRKFDETEEVYDKDKTAIRSEARILEGPNAASAQLATVGGVAGARGNLPGAPDPAAAGGAAGPGPGPSPAGPFERVQETRNYEVNRVVRRIVGPDIQIKRLHVAVLVDHAAPAKAGDPPVARSAQELDHIAAIARESAGLDNERGDRLEVRNVPFRGPADEAAEAAAAQVPPWQQPSVLAAAGVGALVLIAAVVLLLRGRKRKRSYTAAPASLVLPAPVSALEAALAEGEKAGRPLLDAQRLALAERAIHERVVDMVRSEPARAARVLSAWLAEEPSKTS